MKYTKKKKKENINETKPSTLNRYTKFINH